MFSAGMEGAFSFRISAFVLAGFATTSTCTCKQASTCPALPVLPCALFPYTANAAQHGIAFHHEPWRCCYAQFRDVHRQ